MIETLSVSTDDAQRFSISKNLKSRVLSRVRSMFHRSRVKNQSSIEVSPRPVGLAPAPPPPSASPSRISNGGRSRARFLGFPRYFHSRVEYSRCTRRGTTGTPALRISREAWHDGRLKEARDAISSALRPRPLFLGEKFWRNTCTRCNEAGRLVRESNNNTTYLAPARDAPAAAYVNYGGT